MDAGVILKLFTTRGFNMSVIILIGCLVFGTPIIPSLVAIGIGVILDVYTGDGLKRLGE